MSRRLFRIALLATALGAPSTAFAQTATTGQPPVTTEPGPAADAADATSGEVVVTARKTAERLQDVPIAITAFDARDIQSARITSIADVAKLTPGLNYTPLFGRQNQLPIIRGAAQTLGQLNVGVFLDGIYLAGKGGVDLELNDLQRIEVIKGPQSALYGRNTFAGAINYITKRPSATFTGRAEGTVGTDGLYKGQASISGPLSDTLRFRLGGYYREFDGFYRSAIDGGHVDFDQSYGGIGTLEWTPTEALTLTLRGSYSKDDSGQPPSSVVRNNSAPGVPAGGSATQPRNLLYIGQLPSLGRRGVTSNTGAFPGLPGDRYGDREKSVRASATLEYALDDWISLTSITAYARRDAEYTYDGDNTICDRTGGCPNFGFPFAPAIPVGASSFALSSSDGYLRDWSQELRFASVGQHPVTWLFGLFYYDNKTDSFDRGFSPTATSGATAYTAFNPNYSDPRSRLTTKSYAVFGSATWNISPQFALTGELRYEYEQQTFRQCPRYYSPAAGATPIACAIGPSPVAITATTPFTGSLTTFNLRQDFRFVTPRVIANFKPSDDVLLYASYAKGEKTGGFNTGLNIFDNQRGYLPEKSNNYEVGFKSELLDKRLLFNAAAYYIDWDDQQAACQNPVTAGGSSTNRTYTCNVAASRIKGIELEAVARIASFFSISGNYAYTHARYRSFIDDSLAQTLVLAGLPARTFRGRHLPYVPDHKFTVSPRLTVPLGGDVNVEARADLSYQTRSYLRADNFQYFGDKTNLDLRLGANFANVTVQLFANNVTNNTTPVAGVRFFDSVNYSVSSPLVTGANRRQYGATVGVKF